MDVPNAPNPVNPIDPNQDQDQDQAGQVPANVFNMVCSAVLEGLQPSPYSWCRFLSVGGSVSCRSSRPSVLHLDRGLLTCFTPPSLLALPAMTLFSEWQLPSIGSPSASINRYRCCPSALHMCSSRGLQPKHFT